MKPLLASMLLLLSAEALAGSQRGTVSSVIVRASDGLIYFTINSTAKSGSPACATNSYWMIKDENSEVGKKQYSLLLAALASGRELTVEGMNTCTRWADGEDIDWLQLN